MEGKESSNRCGVSVKDTLMRATLFLRAFAGDDPIKAWGQGGGGAGVTSKYMGESGIQTYYEVCKTLLNTFC